MIGSRAATSVIGVATVVLVIAAGCRPVVAPPAYVTALQAAYGPPSQAAFGSALFFEPQPGGIDGAEAGAALAAAYDDPAVTELRVFTLGDGEAMAGILVAGQREGRGDVSGVSAG